MILVCIARLLVIWEYSVVCDRWLCVFVWCWLCRDFLDQLSSKQEAVDEAALDEELRQVGLMEDEWF